MLIKYCSVFVLLVMTSIALAQEDNASTTDYDCTVVQLEQIDESTLTKSELIARMDESLLDSIDQHDRCVEKTVSNNASAGSDSGNEGLDNDGVGNEGETEGDDAGDESAQDGTSTDETHQDQQQARNTQSPADSSGARNQEIAPKDNDAAICQLLREELSAEKDVKKHRELKEIYNSYQCRKL